MRILPVVLLLSIASIPVAASTMSDYTSCAVYYRMQVGHFKSRDLAPMADLEREKMNTLMEFAKNAADAEYGDMGEELFNEQWRDILTEMTDVINRNYTNISRLKQRYGKRCSKLIESINNGS